MAGAVPKIQQVINCSPCVQNLLAFFIYLFIFLTFFQNPALPSPSLLPPGMVIPRHTPVFLQCWPSHTGFVGNTAVTTETLKAASMNYTATN